MEDHSKPAPELEKLRFLIGIWNTEGDVRAVADKPAAKVKGTDTYEWVSGGFFILHRVDVMMGAEKVEVIEIIGYEPSGEIYSMISFDNHGNTINMHAQFDKDNNFRISGDKMRSKIIAGKSGKQMNATWEMTEDGTKWMPWIDMKFTKAK